MLGSRIFIFFSALFHTLILINCAKVLKNASLINANNKIQIHKTPLPIYVRSTEFQQTISQFAILLENREDTLNVLY